VERSEGTKLVLLYGNLEERLRAGCSNVQMQAPDLLADP
jgi:hypothetical protein